MRSICRLKVSWKICHGGTKWLDDNRVVISSVFWGVWASSMRSTSQNPSARFFWSPLGRIFGMRNLRRGRAIRFSALF